MHLLNLSLKNFRNLEDNCISFNKRIVILVGKNAQGKTSLIESLYLLAHTRSFRESRLKEVISLGSQNSCSEIVARVVDSADLEKKIAYKISKKGREFFINDNRVKKATDFYGKVKVVEFTPEDLMLVKGEPQRRRDFVDKSISLIDSKYLNHLMSYQKAVKNRNALLKGRVTNLSNEELWIKILPWTHLAIEHSAYLITKREQFINNLSTKTSFYYRTIAQDSEHLDEVGLEYKNSLSSMANYLKGSGDAEAIISYYKDNFTRDVVLKRTNIGPHRDDLVINHIQQHGSREAKPSASQGQARSMSLAMKIAALELIQEHTGEVPILLLDDVESELDTARVTSLYRLVSEVLKCQTFITAVDGASAKNWFKDEAEIFQINDGRIGHI